MKKVLVVGAGVVGLCVALYALRRGFVVTLVDREPPDRQSCSFGNSGLIVPSHFVPLAAPGAMMQGLKWMLDARSPFYIRPRPSFELLAWLIRFTRAATAAHVECAAPLLRDLCLASRARYESLAAEPGVDFGLVRNGMLILCATAGAFRHECETAAHARKLGLDAVPYAGKDALGLEPSLRPDIAGAIQYPLDCHLSPDRLMAFLEAAVATAGGRFLWSTDIAAWRLGTADRVVAATTREGHEVEADEFVLCTGAWSAQSARQLGLTIPMQAGKGYSLTVPTLPHPPLHGAILAEARVAVTPMNGGARVGGTMELAGLDRSIDLPRVRAIVDAVPRYYAGIQAKDFDGVTPWSGLRPCSPDGLPYIGRTRRRPNLTVAAGHAMMGVTLGPITGTIVAQILSGESPTCDIAQLSPDRFG